MLTYLSYFREVLIMNCPCCKMARDCAEEQDREYFVCCVYCNNELAEWLELGGLSDGKISEEG